MHALDHTLAALHGPLFCAMPEEGVAYQVCVMEEPVKLACFMQ
jgi:hypothetical protein